MTTPFQAAVVIPARDGLPDVLDAVGSALGQTLPPAEIVLVDDASKDGTAEAVASRFGDRVRILRGTFGSAAAARNAGWRAATAPWVALLDADDLWYPEKLARAQAALAAHPTARWFFSDGAFRTLAGEIEPSWLATYAELVEPYEGQPVAELVEVNFILTSSVVVRRDALEALGGFDQGLSHAEDLDLWIRLARRHPATASRESLVRYQHRPGGLTRQVEARLMGDVTLFRRLAQDPGLPPAVRRRARHREALSHYKLAIEALRTGRAGDARAHLARGWMFPERAVAVATTWAASVLPAPLREWLGRQSWARRKVVVPMKRSRRVVLRGWEPTAAARGA